MFFNLPEAIASDVTRFSAKSMAALINAVNNGWPDLGAEVNSGWN